MTPSIPQRNPAFVLIFAVLTCGLYLIYWYAQMYDELQLLTGATPTGNEFFIDLLFVIISCGLYGVWVDYRISIQMRDYEASRGVAHPNDTATLAVVLDIASYLTAFATNIVSSAVHQDQMNKLVERQRSLG